MKRSSPKRFPGLTWAWSGVIAASLLAGCGGAGEAGAPAQPETQTQAATNEPTEPTGTPAPRIQAMEAISMDGTIGPRSRSLVRARLAEGQEKFFREIPLDDDNGERIFLRDDGLNGDEAAGDLVFSGVATVDLESHAKTQDRITEFQAQSEEPLTFATFDNRELVQEVKLTPLSREVFRPGVPIPVFPAGITTAVKPANSLIITHTNVVNDPTRTFNPCTGAGNVNGVWTFKHLATQMANTPLTGVSPALFVEQWLQQTNFNQTINTWNVPARTAMNTKILNVWPRLANGQLDMNRHPFKLVAIVNRLDLGRGAGRVGGYGGGNSGAGELRFVFAAMDRSNGGCRAYGYLDIWEYGVPKSACNDVKTWAQGWLALSNPLLTIGSSAYNTQLQNLTQQVVMANAAPTKPNGSAINQIRRNENMLANPWELREYELRPGPYLAGVTTDMTPHDSRNGTAQLANFINVNTTAILNNSYTVPTTWGGQPFLGSNPQVPNPATMFWNATGIINNNARHKFSLNTCNSCHGRETNTNFTHISATGALSPFLSTGMITPNTPYWVADPVNGANRPFWEIRDRAQHLDSVANQSCIVRGFDLPLLAVH
jgi:hypothetical protein